MALGQISRSERETHAMDSNLTHSPRTSYFSRSELLALMLLFLWVQAESDTRLQLDFHLTESELSDADWTVISLPESSACCVLFNHVHLCK